MNIEATIIQKKKELESLKEQEYKTRTIYKDDYTDEEKHDKEYYENVLPHSCINRLEPIQSKIHRLETELLCLEKINT